MKVLLLSIFLGIIPLFLIAWLLFSTPNLWPPTTDNLFATIILLTIAGVFFLSAFLELRAAGGMKNLMQAGSRRNAAVAVAGGVAGAAVETGTVEDVQYYEAHVGDVNKCIVVFKPDNSTGSRLLVFEGNVRDQLPIGRRVQIAYRAGGGLYQLLSRSYV